MNNNDYMFIISYKQAKKVWFSIRDASINITIQARTQNLSKGGYIFVDRGGELGG